MRLLRRLVYLYLAIGLAFGIARFGWGAVVAAAAEPEERPFLAGVAAAAVAGGVRVVMWAPTLVERVVLAERDFLEWMFYD